MYAQKKQAWINAFSLFLSLVFSFVLGWPAVALFGFLSLKLHNPWIAAVAGPLVYGLCPTLSLRLACTFPVQRIP
ncbi:MAG: hypothetical protein D3910_18360 [Candidatus Electrothrix sp. ATG2]|nr:hypothetical protein [Candidatus Electrothrix sp. ATG2]